VNNRVLIAYYSRTGKTKELAHEVFKGLEGPNADVECLELKPERKLGVLQAGARSLTHSYEPIMAECHADLKGVNLLVLGTPIWGGFPAPYLGSLLERMEDLKGLPVVLFATCAYGDRRASDELRDMVKTSGGRPLDYHVWRIRRDGNGGMARTAAAVVDSALHLLPAAGPIGADSA
jgi:flavodoxin